MGVYASTSQNLFQTYSFISRYSPDIHKQPDSPQQMVLPWYMAVNAPLAVKKNNPKDQALRQPSQKLSHEKALIQEQADSLGQLTEQTDQQFTELEVEEILSEDIDDKGNTFFSHFLCKLHFFFNLFSPKKAYVLAIFTFLILG